MLAMLGATVILSIVIALCTLVIGSLVGYFVRIKIHEKSLGQTKASSEKLIEDAQDKDEAIQSANEEIVEMLKQETNKVLNKVLYIRSLGMKNAFNRSDN